MLVLWIPSHRNSNYGFNQTARWTIHYNDDSAVDSVAGVYMSRIEGIRRMRGRCIALISPGGSYLWEGS